MVFAGRGRVEEWSISRSRNAQNYIQNVMVSENNVARGSGRLRGVVTSRSFTVGTYDGRFILLICTIFFSAVDITCGKLKCFNF
jgi:hypothetical protein